MTQEFPIAPDSVSDRATLAAGLTAIRQRADLSIRELSRRIDIPAATLGGYFSGRNLPQAGQLTGLRRALAACGLDAEDAEKWLGAVERVRTSTPAQFVRALAPYPGLASFDIDDAALFFGRTAETDEILGRIATMAEHADATPRVLAVIGPSGSGKTSLLRAGVAARLRDEGGRPCVVATPGANPVSVLSDARTTLADGPGVLILDQFEELFTADVRAEQRSRFLDELTTLAPGISVVLGMRADYYGAAAGMPQLVPVLRRGQLLLGPLGRSELSDAITHPASALGVTVADGLVDIVLADLAPRDSPGEPHDAGALPLLSHALRAAWEGGSGPELTPTDYRAAGGIDGAIARTAEEAFAAIGADRQGDARRLFVRLVNIDDVAVTRRRITGAEFVALRDVDSTRVVEEFVARRLLTLGNGSLEVSHEALLSAWPRLREWVDEDRVGIKLRRQVTEATNAWEQSGRDDTLLLRGARLESATDLAESPTPRTDLTRLERTFVAASVDARVAARDRVRRRTRRLRRLLAAVVVLFLIAAGVSGYALSARSAADRAEARATSTRDEALSRQLAVESGQLAATDPALGQQIALAAFRTAPTSEARGAVIEASAQPIVTRVLGRFGYTPLALTTDRSVAAVGQAGRGETRLLSLRGPVTTVAATLRRASGGAVTGVAFTPDARRLFAVDTSRHLVGYDVRDPAHPTLVSDTALGSFTARVVTVTPDGRQLLLGGKGGECPVQRWDIGATPRVVASSCAVPDALDVQALAVSADGQSFAAAGRSSIVYLWPGMGPPRHVRVPARFVFSLLFDRSTLYAGDSDSHISLIDPATGRVRARLGGNASAWVLTLALSPDGRTLAAGGSDSVLRRFSLTTRRQIAATSYPTQVTGVAFGPGSTGTVTTSGNGATYVTPAQGARFATPATTFNLGFDRTGSRLVAATDGDGGGIRVWDVRRPVPAPVTGLLRMTGDAAAVGTGAITPSGLVAASGNGDGGVQLFDLRDPATARPYGPTFGMLDDVVESIAFRPDGRTLAAGGDDSTIALWDTSNPRMPRALSRVRGSDIFYGVAWSPSGALLAGADVDGHAYLWSTADPRRPRLLARLGGFDKEVWGVTFSADSHLLAATGSDRTTRVWTLADPHRPRMLGAPFVGPTDYVYSASFSPDNSLLAVSSNDGTVRVYDLHSSRRTPLTTLSGGGPNLFAVTFSPDGRQLVASGRGDSAVVWTADPEVYARRLCARTGTSITKAEWNQYVPGAPYDPPCG